MIQKKKLPVFEGAGYVRFLGHAGPAKYAIDGDPSRLRAGPLRLRGSISLDPDLAELAFRAGDGVLMLEDGRQMRMVMLAHSAGAADVFIEIRA